MARRKKPDSETVEQSNERYILEYISNFSTRSDKTSWNRKIDNMVTLIARLKPIEDKILDIMLKEKQPILDEIQQLREVMLKECIHPYDNLILKSDHVHCKFCNRKIGIPTNVIRK